MRAINPAITQAADEAAHRLAQLAPHYLTHAGGPALCDLVRLILFCRAEVNALARCLLDAGVLDGEALGQQQTVEYNWLCRQKSDFLRIAEPGIGLGARAGGE